MIAHTWFNNALGVCDPSHQHLGVTTPTNSHVGVKFATFSVFYCCWSGVVASTMARCGTHFGAGVLWCCTTRGSVVALGIMAGVGGSLWVQS